MKQGPNAAWHPESQSPAEWQTSNDGICRRRRQAPANADAAARFAMRVKGDASAARFQFGQHGPPVSISLFPLPSTSGSTELEAGVKEKVMS
jgi:hypothetical protein